MKEDTLVPFPGREQFNGNTYADDLYCEKVLETFCCEWRDSLSANIIANTILDDPNAIIKAPLFNSDNIIVSEMPSYSCEYKLNSTFEANVETFAMECDLYTLAELCPYDEAYTCPSLSDKLQSEMNYKLMKKVDNKIICAAFMQAESVIPTPDWADKDSIDDTFCAASNKFIVKESVGGRKVAITSINNRQALKKCFTIRMTDKGDDVYCTGQLAMIDGWEILFVAPEQMICLDKDGTTVIGDYQNEIIFACGQPVTAYLDKHGFANVEARKQGTTPDCMNLNKMYLRSMVTGFKVWQCDQRRLCVTGTVGGGAQEGARSTTAKAGAEAKKALAKAAKASK